MTDGLVRSPSAALCLIFRRCDVPQVRLTPKDLHALHISFSRGRLPIDLLGDHLLDEEESLSGVDADSSREQAVNAPSIVV